MTILFWQPRFYRPQLLYWQQFLGLKKHYVCVISVAVLLFSLFSANTRVYAQAIPYKPGDRVECDWLQNGRFEKGIVVAFKDTDLDQSGRWYRIKLDSDKIPGSTVECLATHMRPLAKENTNGSQSDASSPNQNQPDTKHSQSSSKNDATRANASGANVPRFRPGDRVECDSTQTGAWEKGTVMHFVPDDMDKESGRYYRVRLDSFKKSGLYAEGHQCMADYIRPLNEPPLKASGKYKIGQVVEAKSWMGGWYQGKIVGVEGAFYKVRFDKKSSRYDEMVDDYRLRALGSRTSSTANQNGQNKAQTLRPKMAGALPALPGTAWKIDFGKGLTGTVFLFCKTGRWEIVPARAGSIGAVGKSYRVSGSALTTVNADDGKVQKYKMTWKGRILTLFDGRVTLRLHYNGVTQC